LLNLWLLDPQPVEKDILNKDTRVKG
jgi:hypothetical protein